VIISPTGQIGESTCSTAGAEGVADANATLHLAVRGAPFSPALPRNTLRETLPHPPVPFSPPLGLDPLLSEEACTENPARSIP
jgi:hypothetical protein